MSLHDRLKGYYDRIANFPEGSRCEHGTHLKPDAFVAFLDLRRLLEVEVFPLLYKMEQTGELPASEPAEPTEIELGPCRVCGGEPVPSFYNGFAKSGYVVQCETDMASGDGAHATSVHRTECEAAADWNGQT
ncbi:hypothetical protein [Novosphingobium olei]|uniref:Uncharacterized protein n=1 Tax=Novosphingobium olei TaxID=2728851 RepID=A0A7Y0BPH3_9SPHN|nr:hypothetical protein [Novosphingobium olei]NML93985.1 hypothetical protein [Novosphingobium olei]